MRLPSRRHRRAAAALVVAGVVALTSACTGGDAPTPDAPAGTSAPAGGDTAGGDAAGGQAPVDDVADQVLAEQTVDTPVGEEVAGGTVTLLLRDVRVDEGVLTVRWAMRWDAPDREDDAAMSLYDLGIDPVPLVTDTTHLRAYLPLCVKGDWNGSGTDRLECHQTMLASPRDQVATRVRNHATLEGWAALPAPETPGGSLDLLVAEGLPAFTGVPVRDAS